MVFFLNILMLLFAFSGFFFGFLLSFLAPEEIKPGKKYFLFLKEALFLLISLYAFLTFLYFKFYYFIFLPLIYLSLLFFFIKKQKPFLRESFNYLFFASLYFLFLVYLNPSSLSLLFLALIFLYGFPAGTLIRAKHFEVET